MIRNEREAGTGTEPAAIATEPATPGSDPAAVGTGRRVTRTVSSVLGAIGEALGLLAQLVLVWIGAVVVWGSDVPDEETLLRLLWCLIATVYLGGTVLGLGIMVRLDTPDPRATHLLVGHPIARAISTLVTFCASALGITGALDLIGGLSAGDRDSLHEMSGIWTMLLSWAIFNWGYARIYFSRYHREADPPLVFPGTETPRLVDFVYFSFTNATSFAVSDVQVRSTRMRWTVVWHTALAFFFNAIIIALVLNVVTSGTLLAEFLE